MKLKNNFSLISLVDNKYYSKLTYKVSTKTVENRITVIEHKINPIGIQFQDFSGNFTYKYDLPLIYITPKEIKGQN